MKGSGAIVIEHGSEAFVYVPKRLAINLLSNASDLVLHLDKDSGSGARAVGFTEKFGINNSGNGVIIYAAQGNFNRVKFYVKKGDNIKKTFYLCFLDNAHYALHDSLELLATAGLDFKSDTLRLYRKDTIKTLKVLEPRYSVYQSLVLNGKEIDQPDAMTNFNDPEKSDCIEIDFESHWDKLKDGPNTVTVNVATLDEKCEFAKRHSKTYVIVIEDEPFPWLWVGLGVLALVVLAALVVICVLPNNKKKVLKKADKEECEKLLNEVDECVKCPQPVSPEHQAENPELQPAPKPESEPEPMPEPQPLTVDEILARIKELEEKLSKTEDEKQEALAEQKTKLDELHEKDVKSLREQMEQNHAKELEELQKKHQQELNAQKDGYEKQLAAQKDEYEKQFAAQKNEYETKQRQVEEEHRKQIKEIEANCERAITVLTKSLNEVKRKWEEDKKYVVDMYKAYDTTLNQKVEGMRSNADSMAHAYAEILQIHSESVHSFKSFHEQFQAIMERELTISEMREELARVFSVHIDYDRSWINALCRLHAYAKAEKLSPMFGLYNEYKVDISELYMQLLALAGILGFERIRVPELFVEEFHLETADSDNTNLVLPNIYPNYVEALVSSKIYDIHTVGYTYNGITRKPKVAYYV